MARRNSYQSILGDSWHDGSGSVRYSFLDADMPGYNRAVDTDGDGIQDAWRVGGGRVSFDNDFSMTASEQAMALQAVAAWNEVSGVNLQPGTIASAGVGDVTFASTEFRDRFLFGFVSGFPDAEDLGETPSRAGDVWINRNNRDQFLAGAGDDGGPVYGHTSWNTYLHELGHALGLHHPNENPSNPRTSNQYTVMSYAAHPEERGDGALKQAFPLTPMLWDIEAMQELYGANTTTRTSDTVYFGDGGGNRGALEYQYATNADNTRGMQVQGEDGRYRDVILTIWDAGGQDLIDASGLTTDSRINLRPGTYSSIGEINDNIAMAAAVRQEGAVINFIEDAWGGSGNDRLRGNGADNSLLGQGGRDRLLGRSGNDQLDGGTGRDLLVGGKGADVFVFSGGSDRIRDFTAGEDRIDLTHATGIEDFQDLRDNHMRSRNDHVVIEDEDGDLLILRHSALDDLGAEDFLF
ncbi:M10 family metallopeptidase C-terminal domain-containing protein [Phaeobacter gallaeciensis]|uniref:M10 family metallopeptidase C-terminal domain-containing protein n=1 Tax=Phaeobacter gallaeciensis TaxID=60890 RepID=UPI00237F9C56|nr:M10 family metallopeptidase C-terminal domain-containing protein [Phaeobacter gallaeciensis]MDE4099368.1 M10 family metallopeptidase C-terminal domain-containing protein [Phaeobacter gallaeciensis]MDE4108221.1 M10 family metallopeptidase C-terminal domain-containing protein [Phaeobacter gallaeciensis]MDE4112627.1 M10 family metallopeptidase C-terminal domain-containing protein [Phaeobacter gallaeciensis]MDE4117128.1 M10 family metallopeptidase C-terminal domain-containing protein [Phaeobacte